MVARSTLWAAETSDPVQGNIVKIKLNSTTSVDLSDYILPAWSNPNAVSGPYNYNRTLKAPFTVDLYGYAVTIQNGAIACVFGSKVPAEKKAEVQTETRGYKVPA